ncbi:MAG: metallophosphoesterase [Odoribacter sp.]|nr:metallophosphoesterase [Odoribacter sp.]
MRLPLLPIITVLIISAVIDIFIYRQIRRAKVSRGWCIGYAAVSVACLLSLVAIIMLPKREGSPAELRAIMWVLYTFLTIYVPKTIYCIAELLRSVAALVFKRPMRGISYGGGAVAAAMFLLMWWGALFNRYHIDVNEINVEIPGLPESFKNYRIVQVSDIHTGSFDGDTTFLHRVVERINSLKPDLVVFTGDIVNRRSEELEPYTGVLSNIHAKAGVYSIMGNHDYGDYYNWPSPGKKQADIENLRHLIASMGWKMLDNTHVWLRCGENDSIALVGVENIGDPPFHTYGSLAAAYPTPDDDNIKILLSHNPAHWCDSIADKNGQNFALTLSGHTHAMQIELLGMSPAALRYKTWGGVYRDHSGRTLYVNIGLGEVGMPARIGATPEITLLVLK